MEKSTDPAAEAAAAKAHVEVFQNHSEQVEQTAKWQAHFLVAKGDTYEHNENNELKSESCELNTMTMAETKERPCCFSVSRCSETWLWPEN